MWKEAHTVPCARVLPPPPASSKINISITFPGSQNSRNHSCPPSMTLTRSIRSFTGHTSFLLMWSHVWQPRALLQFDTEFCMETDSLAVQNIPFTISVTLFTPSLWPHLLPSLKFLLGLLGSTDSARECFPPIFERALSDGTEKNWGLWRQT